MEILNTPIYNCVYLIIIIMSRADDTRIFSVFFKNTQRPHLNRRN